jgi:hypothetical protein
MSEEQEKNGADVAVEGFGAKVNVKNVKSLNTGLTLISAAAGLFAVYLLMMHNVDAKEASRAFVTVLEEQTVALRDGTAATREQTCLLRFDQKDRQSNTEFCRTVSGVTNTASGTFRK